MRRWQSFLLLGIAGASGCVTVLGTDPGLTTTNGHTGGGGTSGGGAGGSGGGLACAPGAQQPCTCADGSGSLATCDASGTGFGACGGCDGAWSATLAGSDATDAEHVAPLAGGGAVVAFVHGQANLVTSSGLRRYDAHGNFVWEKPVPDPAVVASMPGGDFAVAFEAPLGVVGVLGAPVSCASQTRCIVVGRVSPQGTWVWRRVVDPGSAGAALVAVASGPDGRIALSAAVHGNVDFGAGPVAGSATDSDSVVAVFSAAGDLLGARRFAREASAPDGYVNVWISALAVDAQGAVAFSGFAYPSGPMNVVAGGAALPLTLAVPNRFVGKLGASGDVLWWRLLEPGVDVHAGYEGRLALAPDGGVLLAGVLKGGVDLGGGPLGDPADTPTVLARFGPDGAPAWSRVLATPGITYPFDPQLAVDAAGQVWVAGTAGASNVFTDLSFSSAGGDDVLLLRLDGAGHLLGVRQFGGAGEEYLYGLALAANGDPLLVGAFTSPTKATVDFGQGPLSTSGGMDGYVAKLLE
jgi:hypothetical protein